MKTRCRSGDITAKYTRHKLKECDTHILIQYFFDKKNQPYLTMRWYCRGLSLMRFGLRFENHFDERRNVDEVTGYLRV